jgi:gliding-associated putative ABC transporter substrate-binding component GldG
MKLTKSTSSIRVLLYLGIFVMLNLLVYQVFFRLDFTEDQRYTLSNSTKNILEELDELVTISAYVSDNLPPELDKYVNDLKDMLSEYESYAGGNLVYEFIDPLEDEEKEREATQNGIFALDITSREKDEIKVLKGFMGAVIKVGNQQEVLPRFNNNASPEYPLSKAIKKLSSTNKPKVGFLVGHGEPGLAQLPSVVRELSALYEVDTLSLAQDSTAWSEYKTLVLLKPESPIPPSHLAQLDKFLGSGGRLFVGINAVAGDMQNMQQPWMTLSTGLENWLNEKGVMVEQSFLIDINAPTFQFQSPQYNPFFGQTVMTMRSAKVFYFPFVSRVENQFKDHPITEGLDQMLLPFASPVNATVTDTAIKVHTLATTSQRSGKQGAPVQFNIDRQWLEQDFPSGFQSLAVALEGKIAGENESKLVVLGDGDFVVEGGQLPSVPDNVNFLVNSIDWLTDDTGLIELRTRGVASRPIEQLEDGERTTIKLVNFLLPLVVLIIFGVVRNQRRRMRRAEWMSQDFS